MNVFNRVILIFIGIIVLAGAVLVFLVSAGMIIPDLLPCGIFMPYLQNIADASGSSAAINMIVSVIVALCMIAMILFEVTSTARKPAPSLVDLTDDDITTVFKALNKQDILVISSTEKGTTSIDVQSLCDLVENVGITVHSVNRFDCRMGRSSEGLLLSCRAIAVLGSNAVEVAARSRSRVIDAIEQLTGLAVARVDIKIIYDKSKKETELLSVQ